MKIKARLQPAGAFVMVRWMKRCDYNSQPVTCINVTFLPCITLYNFAQRDRIQNQRLDHYALIIIFSLRRRTVSQRGQNS